MMDIDEQHVEAMAKMYAENILALSFEIADAITKASILHGGNISNNADDMSQAIIVEALKKATKPLHSDELVKAVVDTEMDLKHEN